MFPNRSVPAFSFVAYRGRNRKPFRNLNFDRAGKRVKRHRNDYFSPRARDNRPFLNRPRLQPRIQPDPALYRSFAMRQTFGFKFIHVLAKVA